MRVWPLDEKMIPIPIHSSSTQLIYRVKNVSELYIYCITNEAYFYLFVKVSVYSNFSPLVNLSDDKRYLATEKYCIVVAQMPSDFSLSYYSNCCYFICQVLC